MFDSHCHLHDFPDEELEPVVERARAAGVLSWLLAGVDLAGWQRQRALARRFPESVLSFGVHPQMVAEAEAPELLAMLGELENLLTDANEDAAGRCAAIGETGLDRAPALRPYLKLQEQLFREQLALARRVNLPIVLHVVDAHGPVLDMLRADGVPQAGGVMHSFSGSAELARDYQKLNLHISFSGAVCNPKAVRLARAVSAVDPALLLIETDAPYQTPLQQRPSQNEMSFLPNVARRVAELRGTSFEQIAELTSQNATRLFAAGN